jgi:uncharacterized protein (DUF169 family)
VLALYEFSIPCYALSYRQTREVDVRYSDAAAVIVEALNLESPPIAIAFADAEQAQAVSEHVSAAPSACSFWRTAENGVFFAPAEAHFNCPVGAMVMGFDLPPSVSDELMELVGAMGKCGYIGAEEPSHIPTNKGNAQGIIYGPLAQIPVEPYAVLCWLTPSQAMIWNEAAGGAVWKGETPGTVFGRPACAALPASVDGDRPVMSLGCMGMRTFTEISNDRLLAVIPGAKLAEFVEALRTMRSTNDAMESFYVARKDAFQAAEPSLAG